LRKIDRFVGPGIEPDQDATGFVAHVFNGMPIALRNVADVALRQGLDPEAPV
jgi:hypothetical protein